jgi:hypothetical protein
VGVAVAARAAVAETANTGVVTAGVVSGVLPGDALLDIGYRAAVGKGRGIAAGTVTVMAVDAEGLEGQVIGVGDDVLGVVGVTEIDGSIAVSRLIVADQAIADSDVPVDMVAVAIEVAVRSPDLSRPVLKRCAVARETVMGHTKAYGARVVRCRNPGWEAKPAAGGAMTGVGVVPCLAAAQSG